MKIKKHVRRGSLAALIALALTSSALAMPTGGEVVRGAGDITVNGGTDFSTIADNATITANNDGQINWQTFNIATGETLNFAIADKRTLVNQVTGAQLSDILPQYITLWVQALVYFLITSFAYARVLRRS